MDPIFLVSTIYSEMDCEALARYWMRHRAQNSPVRIIALILLVPVLLISLLLLFGGDEISSILPLLFPIIVFFLLLLLLPKFQIKAQTKAIISGMPEFYRRPMQQFSFFEDRLEIRGPKSMTMMDYSAILEVNETPDYFYLFISIRQCYMLPKRDLPPGMIENFLNFITFKSPAVIIRRF